MQRSGEPRVDVIIPCYNQGHYLAEAIESVLGQTYPHVGAIVVDDGSADDTAAVAARYGDRVRCLRKQNAGLSAARNTGVLEASGEFLLFLDADDYLWPDMLERHIAAARSRPSATLFHGGCEHVESTGRVLSRDAPEALGADAFHTLLMRNPFPCHAIMVARAALANVGVFDVSLRSCEDWDLWIRLAAAGHEFVPVPDAVAVYRRYSGSMSGHADRMWRSGLTVLRKGRAHHRNCAPCRRAIAHGLWHLSRACTRTYREELVAYQSLLGTAAVVRKAVRETMRKPSLAVTLGGRHV